MTHHHANTSLRINPIAIIAITMTLLFACGMGQRGGTPALELHVDILTAGNMGANNNRELSAKWIASPEELEQLLDAQNAHQLPAQDVKETIEVDFTAFRILMVSMGQKPTAGYSLKLDKESCSISQKTAHVSLIWNEPDPGMVAAQVITSPFILLKLSKGGYDSVEVVDQDGQIWFDLPVDE